MPFVAPGPAGAAHLFPGAAGSVSSTTTTTSTSTSSAYVHPPPFLALRHLTLVHRHGERTPVQGSLSSLLRPQGWDLCRIQPFLHAWHVIGMDWADVEPAAGASASAGAPRGSSIVGAGATNDSFPGACCAPARCNAAARCQSEAAGLMRG